MDKKPARMPVPGLPAPFDALITALTRAGVKSANDDGGEAVRALLTTMPYAAVSRYPCPRFSQTNPDPLAPGAAFDVFFDVDWEKIRYNVAVSDLTASVSYGAWFLDVGVGVVNPVSVNVPAQAVPFDPPPPAGALPQPIVVAGHDYAINVYASWGAWPLGCISTGFVTLSGDPLKEALFRTLTAQGGLPFGNLAALLGAKAKPVEPKK